MAKDRILSLNELIKRQIGEIILRQIDFPPGIFMTITRVETSSNLIQAKVYISVIPEEKEGKIIKILNRQIFEIQKIINDRLKIRPVPKIIFTEEKKTKEAAKVEEILEQIKKENN
jgi:ribosome-binding factor A